MSIYLISTFTEQTPSDLVCSLTFAFIHPHSIGKEIFLIIFETSPKFDQYTVKQNFTSTRCEFTHNFWIWKFNLLRARVTKRCALILNCILYVHLIWYLKLVHFFLNFLLTRFSNGFAVVYLFCSVFCFFFLSFLLVLCSFYSVGMINYTVSLVLHSKLYLRFNGSKNGF